MLDGLQVINDAEILGLSLKCELVCRDHTVRGHLVVALPGVEIVDPDGVSLLGSPLGDMSSVDRAVKEKLEALKIMGSRFHHISVRVCSVWPTLSIWSKKFHIEGPSLFAIPSL